MEVHTALDDVACMLRLNTHDVNVSIDPESTYSFVSTIINRKLNIQLENIEMGLVIGISRSEKLMR